MAVIFMVVFAACTGGQALLIEPALDRLIGDKDASALDNSRGLSMYLRR